eukprot:Gb_35681 [translate_table: standard]
MVELWERNELEMRAELRMLGEGHPILIALKNAKLKTYFLQPPLFFELGSLAFAITRVTAKPNLLHITDATIHEVIRLLDDGLEVLATSLPLRQEEDENKQEEIEKEVELFTGQEQVLQEVLDEERRKKRGKALVADDVPTASPPGTPIIEMAAIFSQSMHSFGVHVPSLLASWEIIPRPGPSKEASTKAGGAKVPVETVGHKPSGETTSHNHHFPLNITFGTLLKVVLTLEASCLALLISLKASTVLGGWMLLESASLFVAFSNYSLYNTQNTCSAYVRSSWGDKSGFGYQATFMAEVECYVCFMVACSQNQGLNCARLGQYFLEFRFRDQNPYHQVTMKLCSFFEHELKYVPLAISVSKISATGIIMLGSTRGGSRQIGDYTWFAIRQSSIFLILSQFSQSNERAIGVPGKSSKECFNRFYSAHPTPPVSQTRSRTNGKNSGSPIRSFANDIHSLLKSSRSSSRRPNSSKQKILHAHKTVRQILRKCKSADKEYETDLFSAVETVDSSVPSLLLPTINTPITPNCVPRTAGISSSDQSLSLHCTKTLSRFSADAHLQLQKQLVSPEVLKRIKNPALHDKYIDLLHSREVARKKTWAQNAKVQSNPFQTKVLDLPKTEVVCAAKAAVIAEAQQVIRQSQTNRKGNCLGIYYHSSENGEEEIDEDDEDAGDEEEEIEDADLS